MTMMKESPKPKSPKSSPIRYLKPGALAKLRDSKITARQLVSRINNDNITLSQLSSPTTPTYSPTQIEQNLDDVVPFFDPTITFMNRPRCLARKKLFPVTPVFTPHTDTYPF